MVLSNILLPTHDEVLYMNLSMPLLSAVCDMPFALLPFSTILPIGMSYDLYDIVGCIVKPLSIEDLRIVGHSDKLQK